MDTLLNLVYTASTIDTFEINPVNMEWVTIEGKKSLMPSKARTLVNWDCQINNEYLYVRSKLKADNESAHLFKESAVIDLYKVENGQYEGSFYIPSKKDNELLAYSIIGNLVVALYKNEVTTYRFVH